MTSIRPAAHRLTERLRIWRRYGRAWSWAAYGARVGARVAIDKGCRIDRAWGVSIGQRAVLERDVWLKLIADDSKIHIGACVFIGAGSEFDVLKRVEIGDNTLIAPRCFITDHTHSIARGARIDQQGTIVNPVRIGSDVWIGVNSSVLIGVTIGDGAVVGAGSVIREDVAPFTIVGGVPARQIGERKRNGF